ncbi:hypothetical protein AACH06_17035 [Ideonella sp. DXS29W]|uniref:Uncharacterized protein n=1 Tax=Ideonella lacteola TaxID=2984193 RepID=A0ABU9BRE6_9BURK
MSFSFDDIYKAVNRWRHNANSAAMDVKQKANWVWESIQGDFNPNRSIGQVGFDTAVCLVPGVDTVMDIRDLIANLIAIVRAPTSGMAWFSLVLTLVGFVPELGSVCKGIVKIVIVKLRPLIRSADDFTNASKLVAHMNRAFDEALPEIIKYLQHPAVQKALTKIGVPDAIKWSADTVRKVLGKVDPAKLMEGFNTAAEATKKILVKLQGHLPDAVAPTIKQVFDGIVLVQRNFAKMVDSFMEPLRAAMLRLADRLDEVHWIAYTQQVNKGWIAPLSEQAGRRLVAQHAPDWVKKTKPILFEQLSPVKFRTRAAYKNGIADGAPELADYEIKSFAAGLKARKLQDGESIYRVVDPTSGSLSTCWVSEAVWKQLNADISKAREMWRGQLAVLPHWNQNGTYVKFTYSKARDGDITVWEGPTAMQYMNDVTKDINEGFLEGGLSQIVWHPAKRDGSPDQLKGAVADTWQRDVQFPDMVEGGAIKRASGDNQAHAVRVKVNDPRIEGPHETGWGFKDFDDQHELVGLPNPLKAP